MRVSAAQPLRAKLPSSSIVDEDRQNVVRSRRLFARLMFELGQQVDL